MANISSGKYADIKHCQVSRVSRDSSSNWRVLMQRYYSAGAVYCFTKTKSRAGGSYQGKFKATGFTASLPSNAILAPFPFFFFFFFFFSLSLSLSLSLSPLPRLFENKSRAINARELRPAGGSRIYNASRARFSCYIKNAKASQVSNRRGEINFNERNSVSRIRDARIESPVDRAWTADDLSNERREAVVAVVSVPSFVHMLMNYGAWLCTRTDRWKLTIFDFPDHASILPIRSRLISSRGTYRRFSAETGSGQKFIIAANRIFSQEDGANCIIASKIRMQIARKR